MANQLNQLKSIYPDLPKEFLEILHDRVFQDKRWVNETHLQYTHYAEDPTRGLTREEIEYEATLLTMTEVLMGAEHIIKTQSEPEEPTTICLIAKLDYGS